MAQAVTVYRWDEPGAPQILDGRPSELLNILKKCLVEGFGTRAPLGWSLLHDDLTTKVFKNNDAQGGSGGVVQFKSSDDSVGKIVYFTPAMAFVDVDNLTNAGYQKAIQPRSNWKAWFLIGTPTAFYFIQGEASSILAQYDTRRDDTIFVGDFKAYTSGDAGRFIAISGGHQKSITTSSIASWPYGFERALCGYSGDYAAIKLYAIDGAPTVKDHLIKAPYLHDATDAPQELTTLCYQPIHIRLPSHDADKAKNNFLRGELPGLLAPIAPYQATEQWPHEEVINGTRYLAVRAVTRAVKFYINLESW
ncbi:hypothetical protein [Pseudoalteromonas ulvae]|uniref:Uncharacterized protein n=1 Tax=Pseudoalteromonas ulvae TaxID=107327 RepID=A0A244CUG8_PSEDV|nr:hypothetical protein [Pseudoalteromonas ulvae]OUL59270.1 hypothetical protein B1199_03095 [Pseudoalteromonas ulvae]